MGLSAADTTARRLWRESQDNPYGIDISLHQRPDDGDAATKDDISLAQMPDFVAFIVMKVSQANFKDPKFAAHYDAVRSVRPEVKRGGYHFLTETHAPRLQAETYARQVEMRPMHLYPACDLESVASSKPRWPDPRMGGEYALEWMQRVQGLVGERPVLYSGKYHLNAIWDADRNLALELAEYDYWGTGYWDNWPKNSCAGPPLPECYQQGRAGVVVGWQWSSGKLSKTAGGGLSRPVPEIEEWRPNKRIDHNLALDLDRWLVGGEGASPPPGPDSPAAAVSVDFEAAWGYNRRRHIEAARFVALVERMGIDGWQSRAELLDGVARWQAAHGLKDVDGKVGPGTIAALDGE